MEEHRCGGSAGRRARWRPRPAGYRAPARTPLRRTGIRRRDRPGEVRASDAGCAGRRALDRRTRRPCRGAGPGEVWNRDAEHAAAHLAGQGVETQPGVAPALDDGHVDAHSPAPRRDQQRGGVRLSIEGQVDRHPGSRLERGQAGDGGGGEIRAEGVIGSGEPAAARAQLLPQLAFHGSVAAHD
jgi:hypothetical protein